MAHTCNFIPGSLHQVSASNDNDVMWDGLWSDQTNLFMSPIEPSSSDSVTVRLRTLKGDISSSNIVYYTGGNKSWISMYWSANDVTSKFDYWAGTIPASSQATYYYFQVNDGWTTAWYSACGPSRTEPVYTLDSNTIFWYNPGYAHPTWVRGATFYQIFVDRFSNGDTTNDAMDAHLYGATAGATITYPEWGTLPATPPTGSDFFGGDLAGIQSRLPYLATLGITALYLTPIFQATSNHRYDVKNFTTIAPELGGNVAFENLMTAVHDNSMAVVLDMVLGHSSSDATYFDKYSNYITTGAYESPDSPYRDQYTFDTDHTCTYAAWWDYCGMPRLNFDSVSLQTEVYGLGKGSLMQTWLQPPYNVDGLRFDVLTDVRGDHTPNADVVHQLSLTVKAGNNNKLMIGELHWASDNYMYYKNAAGSNTRGVDAEMRYNGFTTPVSRWVAGYSAASPVTSCALSTSEFNAWTRGTLANTPLTNSLTGWNSLGTHDTARFLYRSGGDVWKLYLGIILQYTMVGTPMIYYGDEVGLTGATDPDCRRTFDWSTWDLHVQQLYIDMTIIYKARQALQSGSYQPLYVNDDWGVLAFGRSMDSDRVVVIVNNSPTTRTLSVPVWYMSIPDGTILTDQLRGSSAVVVAGAVSFDVVGHWGVVLAEHDCDFPAKLPSPI